MNKTYKCVICKKRFTGWGNNAEPISNGRCCDECNYIVVGVRVYEIQERRKDEKEKRR